MNDVFGQSQVSSSEYFIEECRRKALHFDLASTLSTDQVDLVCEVLYRWRDGGRLVHFFQTNPSLFMQLCTPNCCRSAAVLRGYLYALFHSAKYDELFRVMSENHFDCVHHEELQNLWYEAHYADEKMRKRKAPGPVDKYRIRKKFPPPPTVWDGDEVVYSFKECARRALKSFYERNQYPTADDKREIERQTGLKTVQISNWFKNRRQRDKDHKQNRIQIDSLQ